MKKFTILIAAIALVCFAVPAMAVDWNFYGNARMTTFYESRDFGDGLNAAETDDSDAETLWDLQGNSRVGATIKAENISARFEFGVTEANVSSRRIYGTWNFGSGTMKVGKDYSPTSQFISGQVFDGDLGLLGIGTSYSSRNGQIAFTFGGFEVALVTDNASLINGLAEARTVGVTTSGAAGVVVGVIDDVNGDVDAVLPKLELGWGMSFDAWNFNLMGGAQYYSIEDVQSKITANGTDDLDVTSYVIGGDIGFNFGPGYIKAALSYGSNIGNAGWSIPGGVNGRDGTYQGGLAVWDDDDDTNDTTTFQGALVGGMKVSDMLSFEGGFGYRSDVTDGGSERDTKPWGAYVQSVIALAPGVFIIPEVGYYDFENNNAGDEAGSLFYLGGKWQINF